MASLPWVEKAMTEQGVDSMRVRLLAAGTLGTGPVYYWMSRDQRVADNWALLYAQHLALELKRDLRVVFCLTSDFLGANLRHFGFLTRGLKEVAHTLKPLDIGFDLLFGDPGYEVARFLTKENCSSVVTDFDPLRIKHQWKNQLLDQASMSVYEVDSHNIIPCWQTSNKQEYAAYTIRPKIKSKLADFLTDFPTLVVHPFPSAGPISNVEVKTILNRVRDQSVAESSFFVPGEAGAWQAMTDFIQNRLAGYPDRRNDPCLNGQSGLSPYLHFGQLSAQRLALEVERSQAPQGAKQDFLEELIVRRELADNFCYYNQRYDTVEAFPDWARKSHADHRRDKREYLYSRDQFEQAETADRLWNACQQDLAYKGKLHGYLRMYWAKKILEWTSCPEEAMSVSIYLNDKYSLDGRDPNGYSGIAWSIGGVHDRAWPSRLVFGKVRYMNQNGCRRKFDVDRYISEVNRTTGTN
ncbi:MAG: deoxyribodipyrimidine photo-lyase [Desulfurivibrionaceae bacterium]|nr:deoxyribodipyrimidine photo-lyase [Desulfurivibrionaceae bacterium]